MAIIEPWLPFGYAINDQTNVSKPIFEENNWQIIESSKKGRVLIAKKELFDKWVCESFLTPSDAIEILFGDQTYYAVLGGEPMQYLVPIASVPSLQNKMEVASFALSIKVSREIDPNVSFGDGLYIERLSRILPTYSDVDPMEDDVLLGLWISGGKPISAKSVKTLHKSASWLSLENLQEIVESSGVYAEKNDIQVQEQSHKMETVKQRASLKDSLFSLPGRSEIENFFNEHIVDIIKNKERYKALGIDFPSAVILYGPPGCGKTFAVEQLIEYLQWPSFTIEASSVASPYIHDTSKKIAEVFEKAMENSPSVLVIDEMEAFLTDRDSASHQHHVEEVAEFLRRIPEAIKNEVLIIAMTNKIEMIDPAILRKGRFDHVIKIDFAQKEEIRSMLEHFLAKLPTQDIDVEQFAEELSGRPLSDVAFLIKEGARLTAKSGKDKIDNESLEEALDAILTQESDRDGKQNRMGFIRD